ncbi:MAG: GNAT family N-acetyltransferase [Candidatus Latescibacterota bacterium]
MITLEAASPDPPAGLAALLADLGPGENGFGGTPVHTGQATLAEYLRQCRDMPDPAKVRPGRVPQAVFWALDAAGRAVGMVKVRHYLTDPLRGRGGHISYYVRRDQHGKGYGKEMLRLALDELRALGEERALLTVDEDNAPSIRLIEANGGQLAEVRTDPDTGAAYRR